MGRFVKNYLGQLESDTVNFKVIDSAPTTSTTQHRLGDEVLVKGTEATYKLVDLTGGVATWRSMAVDLNTSATLASASDTTAPSSLACKTYADNLAIAGAPAWSETVSGIGQLATTAEAVAVTDDTVAVTPAKVGDIFAAPPAVGSGTPAAGAFTTLATSGLASLGASATIVTGAVALNLGADAAAGAINVGTGAAARTITIGNVTGATALVLNSGTGGIALASTGAGDITIDSDDTVLIDSDGVLELNSSGGVIGIGNDAVAQNINIGTGAAARTITVGNGSGATQIDLDAGTGGINIGTNAVAHSVTIGNNTGATALALEVGTGNFTLDGVAASTYTIGAAATTGTISIGGTSQTGTMTIAGGDGAQTINIANSTGGKTVAIGTGAGANTVTIGSTNTTSTTTIQAGTGTVVVTGDVDASGDIDLAGDLKISGAAKQLQVEGGAATDFIGQATLVLGTVTVANTNIAATDKVFVTREGVGASTALGVLDVTISAGANFVITALQPGTPASTETNDVSVVNYFIVRQL